jgi:hypothetical protein
MAGEVWRRAEHLAVVESEWRVVALALGDTRAARPVAIEGSGRSIWDLVDGTRTAAGIAEELAGLHPVQPGDLLGDIEGFLASLAAEGLAETVPGPA